MSRGTPLRLVLSALLVVVFATDGALAGRRQATYKSERELVRLDVLVTDRGMPVTGLRPSDFQVLDNGVRQQLTDDMATESDISVVLALDASGSVVGERFTSLVGSVDAALGLLRPGDEVGLLSFSEALKLEVAPTTDLGQVEKALRKVSPGGGTSLRDAAYGGLLLSRSRAARRVLVIFSDGVDTASWLRDSDVHRVAMRSDVLVFAVTVGGYTMPLLKDLAEVSGGTVFSATQNTDLRASFLRIFNQLRQRYLLAYSPEGVSKAGWHQLEVRVTGHRNYVVRARTGYWRDSAGK